MIAHHSVQLAVPADAGRLAEMSRAYIEQGLGWDWNQARVLAAIRDSATNVAVVRARGCLLGFGIMSYGDTRAHLALLGVHKTQRQRGLGTSLLHWLEACALTAGVERILVEARIDNPAALHFYDARGYRRVARVAGYYRGILDAVRFEKHLWTQAGG